MVRNRYSHLVGASFLPHVKCEVKMYWMGCLWLKWMGHLWLNGWGIYDLNGWGIYDLNGWGIYDMGGAVMAK